MIIYCYDQCNFFIKVSVFRSAFFTPSCSSVIFRSAIFSSPRPIDRKSNQARIHDFSQGGLKDAVMNGTGQCHVQTLSLLLSRLRSRILSITFFLYFFQNTFTCILSELNIVKDIVSSTCQHCADGSLDVIPALAATTLAIDMWHRYQICNLASMCCTL